MTSRRTFLATLLAAPAALVALTRGAKATPSASTDAALRAGRGCHVEWAASLHRSIGDPVRPGATMAGLSYDTIHGVYRSFCWPHVEGEAQGHHPPPHGRAQRWEHPHCRTVEVKDLSVAYWEDRDAICRDGYWPGRNAGWRITWWEDAA